MISLHNLSFSVAVLLSSFITMLCSKAPNSTPRGGWNQDRLGFYATPAAAILRRLMAGGIGLVHAFIVLKTPSTSLICPHSDNLNWQLFDWNTYTLVCLALVTCVGGPLRLLAFAQLGGNFTFRLGPPSTLTTTGVYRYMQHPGYTGQIIVLLTNLALYFRWDGVPGCWLPENGHQRLDGWGFPCAVIIIFGIVRRLLMRTKDEEEMLRKTFGAEWIKWHQSTKRFIPGVI
ncbi:Protein-S-isoprenylcysteine O-methyltransferase [Fusarium keratoplasticum]|uniref:Protein-S-isoprenylcysteine O-methyltransferase n=1 Tax=Fusarium keratoplasticum TaxID=1328300 RepID=A0ACC0RC87_9HYPO|nr:Protein-S-isoprenylcysteine O-methyltransferase [Fusarium keratoplasticum]KAI8683397.1 Protein-S-isoprenylcysteine O-methyltransferase [Fusarium keratoplasticum]